MHGSEMPDPLLGVYALGFVFGGVLLLQIRSMLFRQRALTFTVMTILFLIAANIVIVALYTVHTWYPNEALQWAQLRPAWELLRRLGNALYSGVLALLLGPALIWTTPLWAFKAGPQQRAAWR
jgi:predicted DNA repair protein MutK